jgi:tripartite-type tricarboxylate transporter receptor subunit TctC
MKAFFRLAACAAMVLGVAGTASAQSDYPNHPIRLISPYEPGGGVDIMARLVAKELGEALKQSVVVENRPGAGGVVGTQFVANAAPDGYTLELASTSPIVVAPYLLKKLSYDPQKDLTPISLIAVVPAVLLVKPDSPIHTIPELLAMAKKDPGKLTFSSSGNGGTAHLAASLLKELTGADITHIPYKGTGPATVAVMSGEVNMTFADMVSGLPFVKNKQLRPVAVTTPKRAPALPDVPSIAESVPGYSAGVWYGVFGPAKMPPAVVEKLNKVIVNFVHSSEMQKMLSEEGAEPVGNTPEEFAKFITQESNQWSKVIKDTGMQPG